DALEQHVEVVERVDRHADLADLGAGNGMVGAVPALGREIESDREARLPTREIAPVERVGGPHVGMPCIGAEHPGLVGRGQAMRRRLGTHAPSLAPPFACCQRHGIRANSEQVCTRVVSRSSAARWGLASVRDFRVAPALLWYPGMGTK